MEPLLTAFASSSKRNTRSLMAHLSTVNPRSIPRLQPRIIARPLSSKSPQTPLEKFFSRYPEFLFQPSNSLVKEFDRLCKEYRWKKKSPSWEAAREQFRSAMKKEFDHRYGTDVRDINNWLKLCFVLRIDPAPDTLWKCRTAVLGTHVNLVDLVHGSKENVQIFKTEKELSEYTIKTEKYFPKATAKDGGVLRALLRHIYAPREGTRSSRKNKGPRDNNGLYFNAQSYILGRGSTGDGRM
ncbi:hypothetical protein H4582DRAFT_1843320 [Lactarius indigo]|nr:hypothetical protein H4582DRAFT_1843320 [Lactarius indigo]